MRTLQSHDASAQKTPWKFAAKVSKDLRSQLHPRFQQYFCVENGVKFWLSGSLGALLISIRRIAGFRLRSSSRLRSTAERLSACTCESTSASKGFGFESSFDFRVWRSFREATPVRVPCRDVTSLIADCQAMEATYPEFLREQMRLLGSLPVCEVAYMNLDYEVELAAAVAAAAAAEAGSAAAGDSSHIPNVGSALLGMATALPRAVIKLAGKCCASNDEASSKESAAAAAKRAKPRLRVLNGVSGTLRPGRTALLLAPPGHGKSSLLKALTQRLVCRKTVPSPLPPGAVPEADTLYGRVAYSGLSAEEAAAGVASGSDASGVGAGAAAGGPGALHALLSAYIPQADEHFPLLTVRETLEFAAQSLRVPLDAASASASAAAGAAGIEGTTAAARTDGSSTAVVVAAGASAEALAAARAAAAASLTSSHAAASWALRLLQLEECEHTFLGNQSLKGCSGGQRKRVTIAEALLSHARFIAADEISSGLDAAVSLELVTRLRMWARETGGVVLAALQQPTPETFAIFDDVSALGDDNDDHACGHNTMMGFACRLHRGTHRFCAHPAIHASRLPPR